MKLKKSGLTAAALADVVGAALFAFGIASAAAALADGAGVGWLAPVALLGGAVIRAGAILWGQDIAARHGDALAAMWRNRIVPRMLGGRLARPLASGEAASLAVEHVAAIEGYGTRFVPARVGATLGPLFVLAFVFPASWFSGKNSKVSVK